MIFIVRQIRSFVTQESSARHVDKQKDGTTCRYKTHTLSLSMTAPLSLQSAHLINSALTLGYVLPLYFTKYTRLSFSRTTENENDQSPPKGASERLRDDPAVIKARMLSVLVSTMASLCLMYRIVYAGQSQEFDVSRPSSHAFVIYMHFHSIDGPQQPFTSDSIFAAVISLLAS
jgi:hypothetical protein